MRDSPLRLEGSADTSSRMLSGMAQSASPERAQIRLLRRSRKRTSRSTRIVRTVATGLAPG